MPPILWSATGSLQSLVCSSHNGVSMETLLAIMFDFILMGMFSLATLCGCFVFKKQLKSFLQDFLEIKTEKIRGIKDGSSSK